MIEAIMPLPSPMGVAGPGFINSNGVSCDFRTSLGGAVFAQMSQKEGRVVATAAIAGDLASVESELNLEIIPVRWLIEKATYMDKSRGEIVQGKTLIAKDFGGKAVQEVTDAGEHGTGTLAEWQRIDQRVKEIVDAPDGTILFWVSPGEEKADTLVPHRATAWVKRGNEVTGYFYELPGSRESLLQMMNRLGVEAEGAEFEDQIVVKQQRLGENFHREIITTLIDSLAPTTREELETTVLEKLREEAELSDNKRWERFRQYQRQYMEELEKVKEEDIEHALGMIVQGFATLPQFISEDGSPKIVTDGRREFIDEKVPNIKTSLLPTEDKQMKKEDRLVGSTALLVYGAILIADMQIKEEQIKPNSDLQTVIKAPALEMLVLPSQITDSPIVSSSDVILIRQLVAKNLSRMRESSETSLEILRPILYRTQDDKLHVGQGQINLEQETILSKLEDVVNGYQSFLQEMLSDQSVKDKGKRGETLNRKRIHESLNPDRLKQVKAEFITNAQDILEVIVESLDTVAIAEKAASETEKLTQRVVDLARAVLKTLAEETDKPSEQIIKLSLLLDLYTDVRASPPVKVLLTVLIFQEIKNLPDFHPLLKQFSQTETSFFDDIYQAFVILVSQLIGIEKETISEDLFFFLYYLVRLYRTGSIYSFEKLPRAGKVGAPRWQRGQKPLKQFPSFGIIYQSVS